ncbi:MAG: class I adenylate-forming enzyme family protein [Gammaproteobacteria bacterium]
MTNDIPGQRLARQIAEVLVIDPDAGAIEFEGRWHPWRAISLCIEKVDRALTAAGIGPDTAIAVIMRNRPAIAAASLALVCTRRALLTVNPHQSPAKLARDLRGLAPPAVIADPADLTPEVAAAIDEVGAMRIVVGPDAGDVDAGPGPRAAVATRPELAGIAIQMLTTGTTGEPKRVNLKLTDLESSIWNLTGGALARDTDGRARLQRTPAIIGGTFAHIGGIWFVYYNVTEGRPMVLLDRFRVDAWADAIRRHRPKSAGLAPAALRMVLDANLPKEDLASLRVLTAGSAHLPAQTQEEFENRYGIPVLTNYGATEFAGAVCGWTLELHREFATRKRGSAGRPFPGTEMRVVDRDTGAVLPAGQTGLLEVLSNQFRDRGWVRTTDLAVIDEDGFVFIRGRADDAINRGGFKVAPRDIVAALMRHPAVADVSVVGMPDPRLGEVPVAAVETRPGATAPTEAELLALARQHLTSYQVPARVKVVEALPRTPSMKIKKIDILALFEQA